MTIVEKIPIPNDKLKELINAKDYSRKRFFKYEAVKTKAAGYYIHRSYSLYGKFILAITLPINIIYYAFKGLIKYTIESWKDTISEFGYVAKYPTANLNELFDK